MTRIDAIHPERGQFPLFDPPWIELNSISQASLLAASETFTFDRGEPVDGDLGIVLSGAFGVERELSNGRRVLCTLFHRGDLVELRRKERMRQGELIALTSARFMSLDTDATDRWLHSHSDIATVMHSQLREQSARARDHTADLVSKTPMEKLASLLFEFRRWPDTTKMDRQNQIVRIPVPRSDIADYIGVKPETVSRVIKRLEAENLIRVPNHDEIFMLDLPSMRRIANGGRPRQSTKRA